ncbi:hypothetical protein [Actinomadura sp. NEAU-AAG7]|uniref:hypothetical protein n=1 Tax=Actinomadura sp. NEAU-AAG7 TaxID=2839640 RepID=UPI001BE4C619|nr:hypothetical protein [Actinomadura sp. NEAU-AAG7]MBT2212911.1 hypothetical protein [Actinomadura sp. NEAU-AAG7]
MSKRVASIVQWTSFVVGVTGLTLIKALNGHPVITKWAIGLAFVALAIFLCIQIFRRNPNHFRGKKAVDSAWRALLTRADHSVDVFAGDVSWVQDNKTSISQRIGAGVVVRVLCRWPRTSGQLKQVRTLIGAGVYVKFYPEDLIKVRGLVVDAGIGAGRGTALTVTKSPKSSISVTDQSSMFDYSALRHLPANDATQIDMLHQLFESAWKSFPQGIILNKTVPSIDELRKIIGQVEQYERLGVGDIKLKKLSVDSLYSCCRTVKAKKLDRVWGLLDAYQKFGIDFFEPCKVETDGQKGTLLPPIIEQQVDGKLVIVDGMHRLFQMATRTEKQQAVCLVVSGAGALPSTPIHFSEVRMSPTKVPRSENFANYDHDLFRDIKAIDRSLRLS